MKKINIASILIWITFFFVVLTGLNISVFAILSFTNQSGLIIDLAKENAFNSAYILRTEINNILKDAILYNRLEKANNELVELLNNENLSLDEIKEIHSREISNKITIDLDDEDVAIISSNLDEIDASTRNKIASRIVRLKDRELRGKLLRFKLFTIDGSRAFAYGGYEIRERLLLDSIQANRIEILLNENIEQNPIELPRSITTEVMENIFNYINNENDRGFLLEQYNKRNEVYSLRDNIQQDEINKAKIIFSNVLYKIINEIYNIDDNNENYNLIENISEDKKQLSINILRLFANFTRIQVTNPPEAYIITDQERQKALEANTASQLGGRLFTNENLIDYVYMDIYVPIGDLIVKARIILPNTQQQYNSLLRLVLIAGGILIVAHISFIIIAYIILINPMKKANITLENQKSELENKNNELDSKNNELDSKNAELDAENKRYEEELEIARTVQEAILPEDKDIPKERVDIGKVFDSLEQVSGDYLDIINIDEDNVGILVVDVSGHGIPSALVTTMAKVSFNSHTITYRNVTNDIFAEVNKDLCKATGDSDYYCTAVLCVINMRTFEVSYSTGGHPKFLIYHIYEPAKTIDYQQYEKMLLPMLPDDESKEFVNSLYYKKTPKKKKSPYVLKEGVTHEEKIKLRELLDSIYFIQEYGTGGFMIGAAEFARYQMDNLNIYKGDKVIIFSDGVIEAEGHNDTMYEYERLRKIIIDNKEVNSQKMSELIHQDILDFRADYPATDDISIIVLEATKDPEVETPEEVENDEKVDDKVKKIDGAKESDELESKTVKK